MKEVIGVEFETIYQKYFNDVYRYIRKLSNDEHIAEEVTADTFFKAFNTIDNFRGDCDIRVWLCQIAKNNYLSYLRKNRHIEDVTDMELQCIADSHESIEEQLVKHEKSTEIKMKLHEIPEPYKEVFMWRVFADLSFKQIGQIFHKSENWACVTYHRARSMIKNRLEEKQNEK